MKWLFPNTKKRDARREREEFCRSVYGINAKSFDRLMKKSNDFIASTIPRKSWWFRYYVGELAVLLIAGLFAITLVEIWR